MSSFTKSCLRFIKRLVLIGIACCALLTLIHRCISPLNPTDMKPTTIFATVATALIGIIALSACANMDKRITTEYSLIRDLTGPVKVMPDENEIITNLHIKQNIWNGINFSFFNVSDVSYTPHWRITLVKAGKRLASSESVRKKEVQTFEASLTTLLDSTANDTAGRNHSSIYLPMVEELTRLSKSSAERKVLLVYSDLMENTSEISFYNAQTLTALVSKPETIQEKLFAKAKLPDLSGIEIHFVYQPTNTDDDTQFWLVSGFFRQLFEAKGAKVSVSANLTE